MKESQNTKTRLLNKIRISYVIFYSVFIMLSFYIPILEVRFSRNDPWSEISDLFLKIPISIIVGAVVGYFIIFNKKLFVKFFEPLVKSYKAFLIVMFLMVLISGLFFVIMTGNATIYGTELWPVMACLGAIRGLICFFIFGIAVFIIKKRIKLEK